MKTKIESKQYDLKLPSEANVVTPTNIWKTAITIANFGKTFSDVELSKTGSPVNEKNLFRILSYMKYLGLLKEHREKTTTEGKSKQIQIWSQSNEKEVQDFFYYLQDNRKEKAKELFIKIIKKHDLFQSIKNELFSIHKVVTEVDLRDYLRKKIPNKSANYYRKGTNFAIKFLSEFCQLILKEGNKLKLVEEEEEMVNEEHREIDEKYKPEKSSFPKIDSKFVIKIEGLDGTSFKHVINKESDLDDIKNLIEIIRKKIKRE